SRSEKMTNKSRVIRVACYKFNHYMIPVSENHCYGVTCSYFDNVTASLNLGYTIIPEPSNELGGCLPNGTCVGILGMLQRNEVDVALAPIPWEWNVATILKP